MKFQVISENYIISSSLKKRRCASGNLSDFCSHIKLILFCVHLHLPGESRPLDSLSSPPANLPLCWHFLIRIFLLQCWHILISISIPLPTTLASCYLLIWQSLINITFCYAVNSIKLHYHLEAALKLATVHT